MSDDIKLEVVQKTQKQLGKYVKKPVLTEKLLRKPPFRFLHDVITAVIKETGFLKGLFTETELNSSNFTEKEAKVAFLNKLIEAVKTVSKSDLKVRANKIVAGLEPTETNVLLQTIGKALDRKVNTTEYVQKYANAAVAPASDKKKLQGGEEKKKSKTSIKEEKSTKPNAVIKRTISNETPKSTDRSSNKGKHHKESKGKVSKVESKTKIKEKKVKEKVPDEANVKIVESPKEVKNEIEVPLVEIEVDKPKDEKLGNIIIEQKNLIDELEKIQTPSPQVEETQNTTRSSQGSAGLVRPKSARPKSGERISRQIPKVEAENNKTAAPVEMSSTPSAAPPLQRPRSSLRPPSVRPSSARPGAPRLRPDSALPVHETVTMGNINVIVENVDLADDEETVVIHNTSDAADVEEITASTMPDLDIPLENKGHLVEQILEQIQDGEVDEFRKKVEIEWEQNGVNQTTSSKDVVQLRALIQSLTKTANPLGKLLNYLHEDVDAMHGELQMWINTKKQLLMEIDKQKRMSAESNKPLLVHLEQLQQEIKKQEQEIVNVRSNILKNDTRIKEILSK